MTTRKTTPPRHPAKKAATKTTAKTAAKKVTPRKAAPTRLLPDEVSDQSDNVLVFRNSDGGPVAVPTEVVSAGERAYRCHQMRITGASWGEIAEREGYPSPKAAQYDVERYLAEAAALVIENSQRQMLRLEVARLDALQHALWPAAMKGHVQSAMGALQIIVNRAKLTGLDPDKLADNADKARTVVIPGDSAGYIRGLQEAAEHER